MPDAVASVGRESYDATAGRVEMQTLHFEARDTVRVTPEALWPLVSDTARMNRAIGNPPLEYTIVPLEGGGSRLEAQMRMFGLPLARYTEHPFRWEAPHGFVVVRDFHSGPLRRVRAGTQLTATDGGTEVLTYGDFLPRNPLGAALVRWVVGPRSVRRAVAQCGHFERYLLGESDDPFPQLAARQRLPAQTESVAEQLVQRGLDREAVELLRRHLAEAPDEEVVKMRPFELADRWGLDRRQTLALFLHATTAGLLEMTWDVLCPNCRISKAERGSLRELVGEAHCETCNITFDAAFDRSVEVRFSVAPALRRVESREFCLGGPMNMPHVLAQVSVAPGDSQRLGCVLPRGSYRVRSPGSPGRAMLEAADDGRPTTGDGRQAGSATSARSSVAHQRSASALSLAVTPQAIEPVAANVPPGELSLEVVNRTEGEQLVVLEANIWPDTVATAAIASTMPEFRELFSSEAPPPGLQLGIENLAFMFAELAEAGSLSESLSEQEASRLLEGQLGLLRRAISANRGALFREVLSDVGRESAVAAFPNGADALAAALSFQRYLREMQTSCGAHTARLPRIGVHQGPCVAVAVDGRLDYGGITVDTAAELRDECRGGQIVASVAVCRPQAAARLLKAPSVALEEDVVRPRTIDEPLPIYRITLSDSSAEAAVDIAPPEAAGDGRVVSDRLARTEGPLVLDYRPGTYVDERIEAIAADYRAALERITSFLRRDAAALPPITIRLTDVPPSDAAQAPNGRAGPEASVLMTSESPGPRPELVLTPLVLEALFGPGHRQGRFWEDGLAGYLAAEGGSDEHAEAPARVQKLTDEGQLQSLADALHQRAERHSRVAALVATAFGRYLIDWQGRERFCRLLRAARSGRQDAFRRVYRRPLQAVEGEWLRKLETSTEVAKASVRGALRDLRPYFVAYRVQLLLILLTVLLGLAFDLLTPLALRFLIDNILGLRPLGFPLPGIAAAGEPIQPDEQIPALLALLGFMVFMFLVNAVARIRQTYLLATVSEGVNLDLRRRFFQRLQRLPVSFHARTSTTDLSQRFFTDIGQIPAALSIGLGLINSGLAILLFGFTLLSLNIWLGLIAIAGLPAFALASRRGRAATRAATRERARRASEIQQALFENVTGQRFLRIWNARPWALRRFDERLEVHRDLNIRTMLLAQTVARATALITNAAQVAVLVGGGLIVIISAGRELSPGGLMAFYVLLLRLYLPAASFAGAFQTLEQAADALVRVRKVLDQPEEGEPTEAPELAPLRQALALEDVQLVQPNGKAQLNGLTADVPAGSKVAFVGTSGSGKASLALLLSRLEDSTGGVIRWDHTDVTAATRESMRSHVTVLLQETFVLRATIYDNIRLGKSDATEGEVLAAARAAGLHEFVDGLPSGYDTVVSDRDPILTPPVRQQLGVAQALLRDASVVVMEDATTALEPSAQRELEAALRGSDGQGTLIRVAQRLSTIADADRIYVLDEGRTVESGTHDELLERGGLYVQLLKEESGEAAVSGARQAVRRLSKLAPFSSLPPEVLEEMAKLLLFMERQPGQEIVRQDSVGDELFIVGRGEVEIVVADEQGEERVVNVLGEGEYFGEVSFLRREPRTATVRARTPTELHILRRLDFDHLLQRLGERMLGHMEETAAARIEDTRAKLAALSA